MPPSRKQAAAPAAPPKKLFTFSKVASSAENTAGRRRSNKKSKGTFQLVASEYQKGEKAKQRSGNIHLRSKPRFGINDAFKKALGKHTLAEVMRWNDELKVYTVKVYTATQARLLLKAARALEGGEEDLPEDIDESVFDGANAASIAVVPHTIDGEEMVGCIGTTYAWKDELKERGFKYMASSDDGQMGWWVDKASLDQDDLVATFEEYGFEVDVYDGVDDA
jgi:hypothetical protein